MADGVFNVAKGKVNEYHDRVDNNDPANSAIIVVLLQVAEADATLQDYATLSALLAGANTECTFTNYARKVITDTATSLSVAVLNVTRSSPLGARSIRSMPGSWHRHSRRPSRETPKNGVSLNS